MEQTPNKTAKHVIYLQLDEISGYDTSQNNNSLKPLSKLPKLFLTKQIEEGRFFVKISKNIWIKYSLHPV